MDFKQIRIPSEGREKYPSRFGGDKGGSVVITNYSTGGGMPAGVGGQNDDPENRGGNANSFFCYLSKTNGTYSGLELAQGSVDDYIYITGYKASEQAQTLVGDISHSAATMSGVVNTYDIIGLPNTGLSVEVVNNGTTAATIKLTISNTIEDSGTLEIPVAVNINDNPLDPYHYVWYQNQNKCNQMTMRFTWNVNRAAANNYQMDLSNQNAGVNCDADGVLYSNSIATLHCTATTYFGGVLDTGITYSTSLDSSSYAAIGYGISATTGEMWFNSGGTNKFYWNPNYPSLPINIIASKDGSVKATKTMTISRNYPGSQGEPATMRWIETDANVIKFNPDSNSYSPTAVTGTVFKQVGDGVPTTDSGYTIWQWNNNLPAVSSAGSITAIVQPAVSSVTFGLKNSNDEFYEVEDIPVIAEGATGPQGPQGGVGPQGPQGEGGSVGDSSWYMTLDNDNASINCDSAGTIYPSAYRPSCRVKLFYGTEQQTAATYTVNAGGASNLKTGVTAGVLTIATSASNFSFTGDTLQISITGKTGSGWQTVERDWKTMNITKSKAAKDGTNGNTPYISGGTWWIGGVNTGIQAEGTEGPQGPEGNTPYIGPNGNWWIGNTDTGVKAEGKDAVSYWLETSYSEVILNPNENKCSPESIACSAYTQVGQESPSAATGVTIKYQWLRRSNGTFTSESTYNTELGITTGNCTSYRLLRFNLYKDGVRRDYEDVDILVEGKNGTSGANGTSAWHLSLSNDNASINADSGGTIYQSAVRPKCYGKLYYGNERYTGATYAVSYDSSATGIQTGVTNDGILTISGNSMNFTGDTLEIVVDAKSGGTIVDTKTMNITKSKAGKDGVNGEDGEDAATYWLELTTDDMIYDKNTNNVLPNSVTASAYKQIGQQAPAPATDAVITYKRVFRSTGVEELATTTATSVTITTASAETYSIIRFRLMVNGVQRDMEDVGILMNGVSGTNGTSIQGPAIRGPYDYAKYSATTRCWCAGESGGSCSDCNRWIDVILKDGVYYYCNNTYNGTINEGLQQSHPYWTPGDNFDFIATNLLLASGASINFLTNNELYLRDQNNHITGGARGGSGITFWAGEELPENAPFRVGSSGNVTATTGVIGGWHYDEDGLQWNAYLSETDYEAVMNSDGVKFSQGGNNDDYTLEMTKQYGITYKSNAYDAQMYDCNTPYSGSGGYYWIQPWNETTYQPTGSPVNTYVRCGNNDTFSVTSNGYWKINSTTTSVKSVCRPWKLATLDIEREDQRIVFADGPSTIPDGYDNTPGIHTNMDLYGHSSPDVDSDQSIDYGLEIKTPVFAEEGVYVRQNSGALFPAVTSPSNNLKVAVITSTSTSGSWFTHKTVNGKDHWYFNTDLDTGIEYNSDYFAYAQEVSGEWLLKGPYNLGGTKTGVYGPNFNNKKGDTIYFNL